MWFGYPPEVWIASLVAVFIKLQAEQKLTILGALTTVIVGIGCGVLFYAPVTAALGLGVSWHVPIACIISLTADNLLKVILEVSSDRKWMGETLRFWVTKRVDAEPAKPAEPHEHTEKKDDQDNSPKG